MTAQNKRLSGILLTVGGLLIIPLVFMQFSNDVDWTLKDFHYSWTFIRRQDY
jgi:hypothetical protein